MAATQFRWPSRSNRPPSRRGAVPDEEEGLDEFRQALRPILGDECPAVRNELKLCIGEVPREPPGVAFEEEVVVLAPHYEDRTTEARKGTRGLQRVTAGDLRQKPREVAPDPRLANEGREISVEDRVVHASPGYRREEHAPHGPSPQGPGQKVSKALAERERRVVKGHQ